MKPTAFQAAATGAKEAAAADAVSVEDGGKKVDDAAGEKAGEKENVTLAAEKDGATSAGEQDRTKAVVKEDNMMVTAKKGGEAIATGQEDDQLELPGNQSLPLVFFDIEIQGKAAGRIEMELFMDVSPRHAENFRSENEIPFVCVCVGGRGALFLLLPA